MWSAIGDFAWRLFSAVMIVLWARQGIKREQAENNLEAIRDKKNIAERVDNDPAYRESVRGRYR